jgi:hypothetical protein
MLKQEVSDIQPDVSFAPLATIRTAANMSAVTPRPDMSLRHSEMTQRAISDPSQR